MRILIIFMLMIVPIATAAMDICEPVMVASDLPCQLITSWDYTDACNTYLIKYYNSTPSLIGQTLLDDFGTTGLCNATFNLTFNRTDTYTFNISKNGDSGHIIVEVDETMNLAIILGLSIMAIIFIGIGVVLFLKRPTQGE